MGGSFEERAMLDDTASHCDLASRRGNRSATPHCPRAAAMAWHRHSAKRMPSAVNEPAPARLRKSSVLIALALCVWLTAAGAGFAMLGRYVASPGPAIDASAQWPADSAIHRAEGVPMLVMFAHPRCPCSRASISELTDRAPG